MLGEALGLSPQDAGYEDLRSTFYAHYETRLMEQTCIYAAVGPVLDALDRHGVPWGIVTNKASRFAEPSAQRLGLLPRTRALVCGDTTAHTKPHPEPLHEAARRLGLPSTACVYVGDDPRDIQAGRAAGMSTLAVAWGYLGPGAQPTDWGADAVLDHPDRLLHWLDLP
jgi:phosphoglycolate phosphatase